MLPAALMLLSAILHAGIGVVLKRSDDKLIFRAVIGAVGMAVTFPLIFFVPLPATQAWAYLAAGAALHFIYQLSQISAFDRGDMSLVYPIMRGIAPALAAGFAYVILGETLLPLGLMGLGLSVFALIGFGWPEKYSSGPRGAAIGFALLCGVMIALYSVVDATGMRVSRAASGQVISYMVWFFFIDGIGVLVLSAMVRRKKWPADMRAQLKWGSAAGLSSLLTFGLALYAFSLAPIAQMSAMRETSIVFAALFASLFLKERFGRRRTALAVILAGGLILMQIA